jgi:iron complex outermembrane receptor protein
LVPEFSASYAAFNFSTGLYQQLTERVSLRANLASGYRSPNMFELLSNGVHEGTNRYEIGNAGLKTENSYQADLSLTYESEHLEVFVNPYFNYIRHYIYLQPAGETQDGLQVFRYVQSDAFLYGGEGGFHWHPHPWDWLHVEAAYSSAFGQNAEHNDLPLMPSQKINATLRASFAGTKTVRNFSVYLQEQYSLAQRRVAVYETPTGSYSLLNAGLAFEFQFGTQKILCHVAVNNIFDVTYYDHLSRYKNDGIYNIGRNASFGVSIPFKKMW